MRVEKRFAVVQKGRITFYSKIVGHPLEAGSGWRLEIFRQLSDGGFSMAFNGDFDTLFHAKKGMEKWRKGLKWTPQN